MASPIWDNFAYVQNITSKVFAFAEAIITHIENMSFSYVWEIYGWELLKKEIRKILALHYLIPSKALSIV